MISDITKHSNHYSVLALILSLSVLAFVLLNYNSYLQMMVVLLASTLYVIWGVVHHYLLHDLGAEIVLEYFIIALFMVAVFWSFLL